MAHGWEEIRLDRDLGIVEEEVTDVHSTVSLNLFVDEDRSRTG